MHSGRKARRAEEALQRSAAEARELRTQVQRKDKAERLKVQNKLIRGIKGRFNPFEFLPDVKDTLGSPGPRGDQGGL